MDRIRKFPFYDLLIDHPAPQYLRRKIMPKSLRVRVKKMFQMRERPELSDKMLKQVQQDIDTDIAKLGDLLGVELNCQNYDTTINLCNSWVKTENKSDE